MIKKFQNFKTPLDEQAIQIDALFSKICREGARIGTGSYTGDGVSGTAVAIGFSPSFIAISESHNLGTASFPVSGNMAFAFSLNAGVSYIPGTGFVNNAVTGFSDTGITLGTNVAVNEAGTSYIYMAVG